MFRKKSLSEERRQYLRLNSVFPVEFQILGVDSPVSVWKQGFTSNVSAGGICLTINNPEEEIIKLLSEKQVKLALQINIPLTQPAASVLANIAWLAKTKDTPPYQYAVGLKYERIEKKDLQRIMATAHWVRNSFRVATGIIAVLFLLACAVFVHNLKLRLENRRLVESFINTLQKEARARDELIVLKSKRTKLEGQLSANQDKARQLEGLLSAAQANSEQLTQLKNELAALSQGKQDLQGRLGNVASREEIISRELSLLQSEKAVLTEANLAKMFSWLKTHQNHSTGLLLSFEGDPAVRDWAFIYDQSLAAQAFLLSGDFESAKKIFSFFFRLARGNFSGFYNAYYASTGDVAEYTLHCGPNIWMGLAILQYGNLTGDAQYLSLAERIAAWLISIQEQDPEGGLRGGPRTAWFSTEHNLDGYAFFDMLYKITGNKKYDTARFKILSWLKTHAYTGKEVPIKRGKGDSTIATDTYAWSIAALGPEKLKEINMNPDEIIKFAEDNCLVTVNFVRPNGEAIKVKGFDFAKASNIARGGVISSEWTAQMAMSFKIMADFYLRKKDFPGAKYYQNKANQYLGELSKLIINSPSSTGQGEGCLPYATAADVDTGHGWRTPHGDRTGSVAGTAYTIFAQKNYNPLMLSEAVINEK